MIEDETETAGQVPGDGATEGESGGFRHHAGRRSLREWLLRLALLMLGLVVAHMGVTFYLLAALGSDPFMMFVQGCARSLGISVGTAHMGWFTLIMTVIFLTTKGYVLPGTVVCSFCGGPVIDLCSLLLRDYITATSPLSVRVLALLIGVVVVAAGMSLMIKSDAGVGPYDLLGMILTDKLRRIQFRWVRVGLDLFFAVTGFLLGGVIGVGTLAAALLIGPVAQFFFPTMENFVRAAVGRFIPIRVASPDAVV